MKQSKLKHYQNTLGFDLTRHIPFSRTYNIRCSACAAVVINGVPAHEQGCPNAQCISVAQANPQHFYLSGPSESDHTRGVYSAAVAIADHLAADNLAFDRAKFLRARGVTS